MVQNAAKEEKDIRSVNIEQGCSHTKLRIIGLLSTRPGVLRITALGSFKLHYIFIALLWTKLMLFTRTLGVSRNFSKEFNSIVASGF